MFFLFKNGQQPYSCEKIVEELGNGEIVSMTKTDYQLKEQYDTIGFVFPIYFLGLPKSVRQFIATVHFENNKNAYFYSVSTCGLRSGNGNAQVSELLQEKHGIKLNFGGIVRMHPNNVLLYNMMKYMDLFYLKSDAKLTKILPIIDAIKNRENNKIKKPNEFFTRHYQNWLTTLDGLDKGYSVNNDCIGCKICKDICPAKNIEMVDKKPQFKDHYEQCCACLQYCQKRQLTIKIKRKNDGVIIILQSAPKN